MITVHDRPQCTVDGVLRFCINLTDFFFQLAQNPFRSFWSLKQKRIYIEERFFASVSQINVARWWQKLE